LRIAIINGPNLNLLGRREPDVYGKDTLEDINSEVKSLGEELGIEIETFQSNSEGDILDFLEAVANRADGLLVNPGGLTHTSVALRDGLLALGLPFVEVHLSNTASREKFRHHSFIAPLSIGIVMGFGLNSYLLALRGLVAHITSQ
tara:strand:- start:3372 stop:3809 length:438 start_codon:yes stop_codon:yes gene_type:complete